jgi:hypothetical protein
MSEKRVPVRDGWVEQDYLRDTVTYCRTKAWMKQPWNPDVSRGYARRYSLKQTAPPSLPGYATTADTIREHDHCLICGWDLYASDDPDHDVGYAAGTEWVCSECYGRFITGADVS